MEAPGIPWLHGFVALSWHHLTQQSFMKRNNPYGSTIKCTQGYGAAGPSVAPWVRCVDSALFDTTIIHGRCKVDKPPVIFQSFQGYSFASLLKECSYFPSFCFRVCAGHSLLLPFQYRRYPILRDLDVTRLHKNSEGFSGAQ